VEGEDDNDEGSPSQPERSQMRSVQKINYTDENGNTGLYSGCVNAEYQPHGIGRMQYENGRIFSGKWCAGEKVHGKTSRGKSKRHNRSRDSGSKNGSSSSTNSGSANRTTSPERNKERVVEERNKHAYKQGALKDYKDLYNTASSIVKSMIFIDFYGDSGRYTGEVNEHKVPHGLGEIIYDHGLVQEGEWTNGILDEDGSLKLNTDPHRR